MREKRHANNNSTTGIRIMSQTTMQKDEAIETFIEQFNAEKDGEQSWTGEDNVVQVSHKSLDKWNLEERYEYGTATTSLVQKEGGGYAYSCISEGVSHYIERDYAEQLCRCFGTMPVMTEAYIDVDYAHYPVVFDLGEYVGIVAPLAGEKN